jgi:hypothetical protein
MAYKKQTAFSVHAINRSSRRKKKAAKTAPKKAAQAEPKMAKKRRKKTSPKRVARGASTTRRITRTNPSRRRRRVAAAVGGAVSRVRRKISGGGLGLNSVMSEVRSALPRMLGVLAASWCVRRYSQAAGGVWNGQAHTSQLAGEGWGLPQYAIAGAVALIGPRIVKRFVNPAEFRRGVVDLMVQKFVFTEAISRSPALQAQFGAGDIGYQGNQAYVDSGGRWQAMQGIVAASPLDGLVDASALDGPVSGYGHLMAPGQSTMQSRYSGSGYDSNYHAAFSRR